MLIFTALVQAQIVNIPDANFKNTLVNDQVVDIDGNRSGDIDADLNNDGEIQVSEAEAVIGLNVFFKGISSLEGIEAFTNIEYIECGANPLSSLDFSQNINLFELDSSDCLNLESINVSQNSNLVKLRCGYTAIGSLDISQNPALDLIFCSNTNLISLDVSQNPNVLFLNCGSNLFLTSLNINNNNNAALGTLIADAIPNLNCIQVDDVNYANNNPNWTKDPWVEYSEACSLGTNEFDQINLSLYPNPTHNILNISAKQPIESVKIYSVTGILFKESSSSSIYVTGLLAGIYFARISAGGKTLTKKFIKI